MSSIVRSVRQDRLPLLLVLALTWMAVSDIPTAVSLGPLSLSGFATLLAGAATIAFAPMLVLHGRGRSAPRSWSYLIAPGPRRSIVPVALVLFCVVAVLRVLPQVSQSGVQQTSVYLGFAGAIAVAALYSRAGTATRFLEVTGAVMCVVGLAAVPVFLLNITEFLPGLPTWGARSYALAATVAIAALVPFRSKRLLVRLAPYALTAGIAASLSRTALAIAVLLLAFAILRSRRGLRGFRVLLALVSLTAIGVAAFLLVPSLRDRFLGGDNSVEINGVLLNTSGRVQIWTVVVQDTLPATWFGRGSGTASDLLAARYPEIAQPHDDFLRIWHDFGLVGLALFVAGYLALLIGAVRRARRAEQAARGVHWAAALALLAVLAAAVTDNPVIYPFVMLPLGVIVGLSIGRRDADAPPAPPSVALGTSIPAARTRAAVRV